MSRIIAIVALIVAFISLALNVVLMMRLDQARVSTLQTLDHVSTRLADLRGVSFQYDARVKQTFPVSGEIPFHQEIVAPISTTIPFNTTVDASVRTPFGPLTVPVAVNATIPVNLQVPVTISRTIPYSLSIPIDLQVPIQVRLSDFGIESAVNEAQQEINQLEGAFK